MPRYRRRDRDPAEEARKQAVSQATIQRQQQASAYAAARFNEWAAGAQQREQISERNGSKGLNKKPN
jgi:hypothetical protein